MSTATFSTHRPEVRSRQDIVRGLQIVQEEARQEKAATEAAADYILSNIIGGRKTTLMTQVINHAVEAGFRRNSAVEAIYLLKTWGCISISVGASTITLEEV